MSKASATQGLRGRQKEKRRAAILAAARSLFDSMGYQSTSMEAIADSAEVGVATVYNYFGSKGSLLAELLQPEFQALYDDGDELLNAPPQDPVSGVLKLLDIYRHFQNDWHSRKLLSAIIGPGLAAEPVLDELTSEAESEVKRQLTALLLHYKTQKLLKKQVPVDDMVFILFSLFNQHYIEYITHGDQDFAQMRAAMDRQIQLFMGLVKT